MLQVLALTAGAAGGLLAAAGFEVWIGLTTAIAANVVAYLGYLQVRADARRLQPGGGQARRGAARLGGAAAQPKRDFARLVADCEGVLATELSGWVQQMNQAIEEAARKHETSARESKQASPQA